MRNSFRELAFVLLLCASPAIAQEVTGAKAEPSEISIGDAVEIVIDFRTIQAPDDNLNPNWSCGLEVNYGDGKIESHRIEAAHAPYKLIHKYEAPGNYAVMLEGKTRFRGFNTVFSCGGDNRSVAIVVRPENFAAREAAERAEQEELLKRAVADRLAAQRAAERAKGDRVSAERAAKKAAMERKNAEREQRTSPTQTAGAAPKSAAPSALEGPSDTKQKPAAPSGLKAKSAMDL